MKACLDKSAASHYLNHLIFLSMVSTVLYFNTLRNGFVFDDIPFILENIYIGDLNNIKLYLFSFSRGIKYITLIITYYIWGLNPVVYHLTNLLLHIFITILVYIFTYRFLKNSRVSLITGLLFAAHPIHTEAVANISNRNDLLSMLFFLSSLILYTKRIERFVFYVLSISCYVLAILSKEVAIVLPLILILYDFYSGTEIYKNIRYYIPYFLIGGLFFVAAVSYLLSFFKQTDFGFSYPTLFLLITKTISFHINQLILPVDLNADHEFLVPSELTMGNIVNVLMIIGSLILLLNAPKKMSLSGKGVSFGGLWVFINLIPVSNIIPLKFFVSNLVSERYLYIPSFGFCLIMAIVVNKIMSVNKMGIYMLIVILGIYSGLTIKRNPDWRSENILWSKTARQSPNSFIAHNNLGVDYLDKGELDKAEKAFRIALRIRPDDPQIYLNLGNIFSEKKLYGKAEVEFKKALRIRSDYPDAHNNLGNIYLIKELLDQAIEEYKEALKMKSNYFEAYYNLGSAYDKKGMYKEAINYYQRFLYIPHNMNITAMYQPEIVAAKNRINILTRKNI